MNTVVFFQTLDGMVHRTQQRAEAHALDKATLHLRAAIEKAVPNAEKTSTIAQSLISAAHHLTGPSDDFFQALEWLNDAKAPAAEETED